MSFADFRNLFFQVSAWTIVVPGIIAAFNFKFYNKPLKWVSWYIWFGTIVTSVSYLLWLIKLNNMLLGNIYTVVEYFLIAKFFSMGFNKALFTKILLFSAILLTIIGVIETIEIGVFNYNSITRSVECIFIIACSVIWFLRSIDDYSTAYQSITNFNLIVVGLLTYFTSAVLLFAFRDFVAGVSKELRLNIWCIHSGLLLVQYIFITYALWKHPMKPKYTTE